MQAPFHSLSALLVFILYKELQANPIHITTFIALKPCVSMLSIYWSKLVHRRPDRLLHNLYFANFFAYTPFLLFPWIPSVGYVLFSSAVYMTFKRGIIPAWMELLKRSLTTEYFRDIMSYTSTCNYLVGIGFSLFFASYMDINPGCWRYLFLIVAIMALCGTYIQVCWIRLEHEKSIEQKTGKGKGVSFSLCLDTLLGPWKESWEICCKRKDVLVFQLGFMFGGGGLMIMQPALPVFFLDCLHLSYAELALALSFCKGLGFVITSYFWRYILKNWPFYRVCGLVPVFAFLFLSLLFSSLYSLKGVYLAYCMYGAMQAGSQLTWHLSGPIFSQQGEDSSPYSTLNILSVGLRGTIVPLCGAMICSYYGGIINLLISGSLCIISFCWSFYFGWRLYVQRPV
jgi:hypothetical protein